MCPAQLPIEITQNLFVTAYPEMVEILQLLSSSSFMCARWGGHHTSGSEIEQCRHRHGHSTGVSNSFIWPGILPVAPLAADRCSTNAFCERSSDASAVPPCYLSQRGTDGTYTQLFGA